MITCEEAHVEEKNIQIHDEIQLETHEIQNLLTDDERLLLDKLVQTDGRNQLYLRSNTDVSISNISSSLNSLNVETPPNSLVGHPPFAHSQVKMISHWPCFKTNGYRPKNLQEFYRESAGINLQML